LKREFGKNLCFHGLLDTQHLMPYGTPQEILTEVKKLVEEVGAGGGLALAPSNNFQIDVPVSNILAMYGATE
jgi:uroporphyrinogen decarboxylase